MKTLKIKSWRNHTLPELEGFQWELFSREPILRRMSNEDFVCWINTPQTNAAISNEEEWSVLILKSVDQDGARGEGDEHFFDSLQQCLDFIVLNARLGTFQT